MIIIIIIIIKIIIIMIITIIMSFVSRTNLVREVNNLSPHSNELHDDVLRCTKSLFGKIDPVYHKTLISSTKKKVQIVCVRFIN